MTLVLVLCSAACLAAVRPGSLLSTKALPWASCEARAGEEEGREWERNVLVDTGRVASNEV